MRGFKRLSKYGKAIRVLKSVQRNTHNIGIWLILPFALRIFNCFHFSSPKDMLVSNIRSHFQERLEMGFDDESKWDGRGRGGDYLSFSSAKLLLNLLLKFLSFLSFQPVREHSSVALAAVNLPSFPILPLWLCRGKINIFAIFCFLYTVLLLEIKNLAKTHLFSCAPNR